MTVLVRRCSPVVPRAVVHLDLEGKLTRRMEEKERASRGGSTRARFRTIPAAVSCMNANAVLDGQGLGHSKVFAARSRSLSPC